MAAPTKIDAPWPSMSAGTRLVTSAFTRSELITYGDQRANERDEFWRALIRLLDERLEYGEGVNLNYYLLDQDADAAQILKDIRA